MSIYYQYDGLSSNWRGKQWRIQDFQDGGRQFLRLSLKIIICKDFCRKLHENGSNWTEGHIPNAPLDPTMVGIMPSAGHL